MSPMIGSVGLSGDLGLISIPTLSTGSARLISNRTDLYVDIQELCELRDEDVMKTATFGPFS